ncbi:hypothetical protein CWC46_16015 [Prodigiosinella confusarubida]|uniref:Uncharacterized protein n=1 Tax=Serratia sp. (strain ATCC 39006) TaxID=104623 RepID=A0A2I5TLS5_SERS3|nr:hypothetical protein CWC46_16015 [Serratia sp. ATCC 39006]AUH05506.1 hypothetical protein Ser39006_016020 [Serratia sp. ATCC 39006]
MAVLNSAFSNVRAYRHIWQTSRKTSHITTGIERMIFTRTVLNSGLPSAFLRFAGVRVSRTSSLNSRTTIL